MTFTGIIILLILAAVFASLGQFITGYRDAGWIVSTVLGFVGAFIGLWLAGKFHLPPIYKFYVSAQPFPIIWVMLFAAIFVLIAIVSQRAIVNRKS
ncbi:MAG: hypothetical protein ABJB05_05280 [Parafilimonas sp.]